MKKYKLTEESIEYYGRKLFRIEALVDIKSNGVSKGDKGGFVEKEENLDVSGDAWVSGNAQVYGNAWVSGDASPKEIMRLDEVRKIVLDKPTRLDMSGWHAAGWTPEHTPEEEHECGSAHCIAGWLQALSDDPKVRGMKPQDAGCQLAPVAAASGIFFVSNDVALEWLTERRYAKQAA